MFAALLQLLAVFHHWVLSLFVTPQPDLERGSTTPTQAIGETCHRLLRSEPPLMQDHRLH